DGVTGTVGMEYMTDNYRFPLGTNHKFNGFADNFLGPQANGLADIYLSAGTKLGYGIGAKVFYHHFTDADFNSLGDEIDMVFTKSLTENVSLLAKTAWFLGKDNGPIPNTNRASIEVNVKF
ncbi:MAG: hypothetical protein AAF226_12745, partial [Verrucomicrobiota bacterium]